MRSIRALPTVLITVLVLCGFASGQQPAVVPSADELTNARQMGWVAATHFTERLAVDKQTGFPVIEAWLSDFNKQTKGLDPKCPPEEWPKVDVDALAIHNPKFWRAFYEIAPGDPGAALLYAGILLGGGENVRSLNVMEFHWFRPGIPPGIRTSMDSLRGSLRSGEEIRTGSEGGDQAF